MPPNHPASNGISSVTNPGPVPAAEVGPHPSHIQVAKPFLFQQQLQSHLVALGINPTREDIVRLHGVQWINEVRTALQLPVRTFCTACIYYHKFRLIHKETEYQWPDAAAAALLTACKIEDTLKKSREILCAAYNSKVSAAEYLSSDDPSFEASSKITIGLERLMLEASGFDFRNRYPQKHLIKLVRHVKVDKDIGKLAYNIMIDLYRTFAPLKQTSATMSFACVELATLLAQKQQTYISGPRAPHLKRWSVTRGQILETIMDILDLYTHFQKNTIVGANYNMDTFISLQIKIKQEMEGAAGLSRYTEYHDQPRPTNGRLGLMTPKTPITPASPADINGNMISPTSPRSGGSGRRGPGQVQEGTVRFMLDNEEAKREKATTAEYFKVEYEDYEVEVEEPIPPPREERGPQQYREQYHHGNHFHRNERHNRGYFRGRGGRR